MYQINTLYALNIYNVICKIYSVKIIPQNITYYAAGIIIGTEGTAVNKTDTNPCLHGVYNLVEDFFFSGHLLGKEFHRKILYVRTYPMASGSAFVLQIILFLIGRDIMSIHDFSLWKVPKRLQVRFLFIWVICCP